MASKNFLLGHNAPVVEEEQEKEEPALGTDKKLSDLLKEVEEGEKDASI